MHPQTHTTIKDGGLYRLWLVVLIGFGSSGCSESHTGHAQAVENLGGTLIAHLEFSYSGISDEDLTDLYFPETVRSISLRQTGITDIGLAELGRAPMLKQVDLTSTNITDEGLLSLADFPNLETAEVIGPGVSRVGYKKFTATLMNRMSNLRPLPLLNAIPRIPLEKSADSDVPKRIYWRI